jgi:branched-subunit amino acid aminotransferase/4-amino-4-deoxychorismate lyase
MTETIRTLTFDEVVDGLRRLNLPYHDAYLAMYSSWYGGIVRDPALMMVPIDDHLVHRGDGIFEAFKSVRGAIYLLNRHLDRLERSAAISFLTIPHDRDKLVRIILACVRAASVPECIIRVFVSRGPGGYTTNPYECPASQLYVVVTTLQRPAPEKYLSGATLRTSAIPVKPTFFAGVKSCNYLPNVLMKKEAVDAGVDYTVSLDENGFLAEGPTENIGIVTDRKEFIVPRFERVLRGTTVTRALELAQPLVAAGELARIIEADITPLQAREAAEIMMFGTSFDVLPVVQYDGHAIGTGRPGPFAARFQSLIEDDMVHGVGVRTPIGD